MFYIIIFHPHSLVVCFIAGTYSNTASFCTKSCTFQVFSLIMLCLCVNITITTWQIYNEQIYL